MHTDMYTFSHCVCLDIIIHTYIDTNQHLHKKTHIILCVVQHQCQQTGIKMNTNSGIIHIMCIHICIYTCIYIYVHICAHSWCVYMQIHARVSLCVYMYKCIYV